MLQVASQTSGVVDAIRSRYDGEPRVGIILGSGLGGVADKIENPVAVSYAELPHLPASTADGHRGRFILGELAGVSVAAMQGRFHLYEGYSPAEVTLPVRVMGTMGVNTLIVTNAAGGVNPQYACGDIVVIEDHIDLMAGNPLIGVNDDNLGPRFPDMSAPYDAALIDAAIAVARRADFTAHRGVYVGMTGPTYETRAEYRFLRRIGGDVIGMSTVPEVIVARHMGLRVLGLSTVTNVCLPDALSETSHEEVVAAANLAEDRLTQIVLGVLKDILNRQDANDAMKR